MFISHAHKTGAAFDTSLFCYTRTDRSNEHACVESGLLLCTQGVFRKHRSLRTKNAARHFSWLFSNQSRPEEAGNTRSCFCYVTRVERKLFSEWLRGPMTFPAKPVHVTPILTFFSVNPTRGTSWRVKHGSFYGKLPFRKHFRSSTTVKTGHLTKPQEKQDYHSLLTRAERILVRAEVGGIKPLRPLTIPVWNIRLKYAVEWTSGWSISPFQYDSSCLRPIRGYKNFFPKVNLLTSRKYRPAAVS